MDYNKITDASDVLSYKKGRININDGVEQLIITISSNDYFIDVYKSKGGNSVFFQLFNTQYYQSTPEKVIKICKYKKPNREDLFKKIHKRFIREIEALLICKENSFEKVVEIFEYGTLKVNGGKFLFYTMEYAESDLMNHLLTNELDSLSKIDIVTEITQGIKSLHKLGIYHRDIKPDNILLINGKWKIGDLGLIAYRDSDIVIDEFGDLIGPRGWLSPEVMNKFLTELV
jgi:serine/threonine protein kinase